MEPRGEERTLRSEKVQIERKTFFLDLKENDRGRFLRIRSLWSILDNHEVE